MTRVAPSIVVLLLAAGGAFAQPEPQNNAPDASETQVVADDDLEATRFDPAMCVNAAPGPVPNGVAAPPVTWSSFSVEGQLRDAESTVRALLDPTMSRHRALTDAARDDIRQITAAFGYHLVGLRTKDAATGSIAVVHLSPLPMVRKVDVDVKQSLFDTRLDDEIRRRMRMRTGSYLPWLPRDRECDLHEEKLRIEEFLRDEGFFDAKVRIRQDLDNGAVSLKVKVALGDEYTTGIVNIAEREPNNVSDDEIRTIFRHSGTCIVWTLCVGSARFKRTQHQADLQKVVDLFHERGYPAVRVRSDFDPRVSFDRKKNTVSVTITIDQRRQLEVVFEGQSDAIPDTELRKQLTFYDAASSDDVEAHDSARAIAAYLQGRGYFDARVTWTRERFEHFDRIIYRIEQGETRRVETIDFVGNHALTDDELREVIATREARLSSSFFGARTSATSAQLATDVDQIVERYRRAGYREARARVSAATQRAGLDSAALTASLVLADRGNDLHVRYTIDEGLPTLLTQVEVQLGDKAGVLATAEQRELCKLVLADLAMFYEEPQLATQADATRCIATAANLRYRETEAAGTRDLLKDRLYSHGRPRAKVTYEARMLGPHRIQAHYQLTDIQVLTIGKVVIRGNFRTRTSIILGELRFTEGAPLTKDVLAEGARRLRNTGLFDAVNVAMPDLDNTSEGSVNAVVEVAERFDFRATVDAETGLSTYNGAFIRLIPSFKNLFGAGVSLDLAGTIGFAPGAATEGDLELRQLGAEATLRFPPWLWRRLPLFGALEFQTELTAFHRRQDTPRFGVLTTDGVTVALSRTWQWQRTATSSARAITVGPYYDFRLRERPVDVLRSVGADDDQSQVPISTRTGSFGLTFDWEQRVDRSGTLSPLAPEAGFRLEARASFASPYLGGQDTFFKVSAGGSKYWPLGSNVVLRADLRYDQGFPLAGAVLLPEVERFFAGGDSTVRGYEDDRLETEIIQVAVPPLDNVQQIRILPAGGNIRVMSSVDAQVRIYKVLAAGAFVDVGMITNQWANVTEDDIRPSVGVALFRIVTPFGTAALERAMPLRPHLGDNPRGRWHLSFAARAQF
ncbi:MAG: surface antigen [Myxococcales bacterium]|nr:surface antigen [Myxococcales bacterium]